MITWRGMCKSCWGRIGAAAAAPPSRMSLTYSADALYKLVERLLLHIALLSLRIVLPCATYVAAAVSSEGI